MINPEYIRTFITLVETGHFTKTAEKLHMTQPGVSQHIQKLEEHFGAELIHRTGKSFTVAEGGRKLIEYGHKLFSEYQDIKVKVGKDDPYHGECRLSAPGSFGLRVFDVLIDLAKLHSDLCVSLIVAPNSAIPSFLLNRQIDVGYMTSQPNDHRLESEKFSEEELLLISPRGARIRTFEDLVTLGFVNHPDGHFLAERLLAKNFADDFQSMNQFRSRVFINQISRILDPVAEGLGFTVLPEGAYRNYAYTDKLSVVRLKKKVADEVYKVRRKNEKLPNRYATVEKKLRGTVRAE